MPLSGWEYLDDEKTKWILEQAEAKLKATNDVSNALDQKSVSLRTITLSLLTAIIGYGFAHLPPHPYGWANIGPLLWLAASGATASFALWFLVRDTLGQNFYSLGSPPHFLMIPEFLSGTFRGMLQGYIQEIDDRISFNLERNERRIRLLDITVWFLMATPPAAIVTKIAAGTITRLFS